MFRAYIYKVVIAVMLLVGAAADAQAKVVLVSVGISQYSDPSKNLTLPAADATTMQKLISKNGGSDTSLLLNSSATKAKILSELRDRFAHASTDDIIIFFFSGHGYEGGFVAYDAKLSYGEVRAAMGESRCKNKMIFADACFSGKMRQGKRKVREENQDTNVMLFLSSRDNEVSIERRDMTNGFFTVCLKDGMAGKADSDRNRVITAKELFTYVSKNVKLLSNDKQHPVMWGNFPSSMPVIKW